MLLDVRREGQDMETLSIQTHRRNELVDITPLVRQSLNQSGIKLGVGVIYCPHTTAAITINENADPDVVHDMLLWLERAGPKEQAGVQAGEGNSRPHIKGS